MTDVAGSLGQGKLIILAPAFTGGDGIEVAVGLARWWTRQLRDAGKDVNWFLIGVPETSNPRQLQVFDAWPERQIAEVLVAGLQARFGLAPESSPDRTRAKIGARLFEITGQGSVQAIDGWTFEGSNNGVPRFAFEVVEGVTRCLGAKPVSMSWRDAFGTGDEAACCSFSPPSGPSPS